MKIEYSAIDLLFYLILYSFVGWGIGVACIAVRDRHFVNRGLLNLPFAISEGITAVILLLVLPTMPQRPVMQFLMTWVVVYMIDEITEHFLHRISGRNAMASAKTGNLSFVGKFALRTAEATLYLLMYLLIHPFVFIFVSWLPDWLVTAVVITGVLFIAVDYAGVVRVLHRGKPSKRAQELEEHTQRMAERMTERIWNRLEKAYPGIEQMEQENQNRYTFAKGICFDKLVWVFLISSFLGALIEMVYCRAMGDIWMNRSSVLYGSFSFVWGFGAVVLTVVLQKLAGKADRYVFLAGFVVGGAYEYLCSVFTQWVFGTVFWDYSEMPLNIGGRTNVLYCIFWGILAVVWIKVLYPPMERGIEKIPPLTGKILTWVIVVVMLCNGLLTAAAMQRYTLRQTDPEPANMIEALLDDRYDDAWMERRWPNMVIPEE